MVALFELSGDWWI
uniref:Uncharacterized protein n=1 Tax=Rhizophora mucronata TaxID=61149 RepID=A0A2P2NNC6_RHIMU